MTDTNDKNSSTFERLDAYRVARDGLKLILEHKAHIKGLPGEIGSQLQRAAVSTVALIAEGAGRQGRADQKNRFSMARAEANEVAAMVELAALYNVFPDGAHARIRNCYFRVVQMLTAMILR